MTPLYSCDRCGLGLPIRRKLVSHLETHGDEEFICEVCDKSFRSKPRLTEHTKKIMQKRTNAIIVEPNLVTKYIVLIYTLHIWFVQTPILGQTADTFETVQATCA